MQITLGELKTLVVKLQTDPQHNFQGGKDDISPLMHAEIEALLKFADKDKSGTITFDVCTDIFIFIWWQFCFSEGTVIKTFLWYFLTVQEFQQLWERLKGFGDGDDDEAEIREEFDRMDADGSGYISKEEILKMITTNHRLRNVEEEAKKCLDEIDVDGNGMISYPEFLMVWKFKA